MNGSRTIGDQLNALLSQSVRGDVEFLVVDNGSDDGTVELVQALREHDNRLNLVLAHERQNLSYARNVGVEAAMSNRIAFCDDDDLVSSGWVDAIFDQLDKRPLVASRLEYSYFNAPERMIGRSGFQSEGIETMFGLPLVNGAGFGCWRSLWLEVGGNDEDFGQTGEDFDFSMRVFLDAGVKPTFVGDAVYHYRMRTGARGTFRQSRRYGRSHVQLYRRHGRGRVDLKANTKDALRSWWWVLTRLPLAAAGTRRENWATNAGRRVGRLQGCLAYRSFLL